MYIECDRDYETTNTDILLSEISKEYLIHGSRFVSHIRGLLYRFDGNPLGLYEIGINDMIDVIELLDIGVYTRGLSHPIRSDIMKDGFQRVIERFRDIVDLHDL